MYFDSKQLLQGKWHLDFQLHIVSECQICLAENNNNATCMTFDTVEGFDDDCEKPQHELLLLISLLGSSRQADADLPPRQCEILSQFVHKERSGATRFIVGSQQHFPACCVTPTTSSALILPSKMWSCFSS